MVGGWKSGKIEKILISLIFVCLEMRKWNGGRIEKVSLYKFMHISLLKNDTQLKPKKG